MGGNTRVVRFALVLLLVALLAGLAGLSAQAAISDVSSLGSSTHPAEDTWYADDAPSFEWSGDFPSLLGSADTTGNASEVAVYGNVAYVADANEGLATFDVTDPSNPVCLDTIDAGLAEELAVAGDVVYVAGRADGLFAIDATDPEDLQLLDTLDGADGVGGGAWSVDLSGDFAYITSETSSVVQSVDISNPESLALADTYQLHNVVSDVTVAGNVAYVAENDWGMYSIDISDPNDLSGLGHFSSSRVGNVEVAGDVAFVSLTSGGLRTVDISDPANMVGLDNYDSAGIYGRGLDVSGDLVFLTTSTSGVLVFDVSDPSAITLIGDYATGSWSLGVTVSGDTAFVAAGTTGFVTLDIMDYVAVPSMLDRWTPPGGNDNVDDVFVAGDVAYVANDGVGLSMIDIADPESVSTIASFDTTGTAKGVTVQGNVAYVADWGEGLATVDISDPANPVGLGSFVTTDQANAVAVSGDVAYLAAMGDGLVMLDVSVPSDPVYMGSYVTGYDVRGVEVEGDAVYFADNYGLNILNISNPVTPAFVGVYHSAATGFDVTVERDYAYLADHVGGLKVVDVSNPAAPTLAGSFSTPGVAVDVKAAGDRLFVSSNEGTVTILDISDPTSPSDPVYYGNAEEDHTEAVAVAGDVMYVAARDYGLEAVQIGTYPAGYSYELDVAADTTPDAIIDGTTASKVYAGIADGDWYFHVRSVDRFGTALSSTLHRKVRIDMTDPSTSSDAKTSYVGQADITLSAEDGSGSGIDATIYTVDGGTEQHGTSVSVDTIGAHTLTFWSTDLAGNEELPHNIAKFSVLSAEVAFVPIAGTNRYATAIAASKEAYPSGAGTVVIATGENWPDALGGSALAGTVEGPLLLTKPGELPAAVVAEITRLKAKNAYILGGTAAVTQAVEDALNAQLSGTVTRIAGASRYGTANKTADEVIRLQGSKFAGGAYIATGDNFPDALGASPLAASTGAPILLTKTGGTPYLPSKVDSAVILGGPAAVTAATEAAVRSALGTSKVTRVGGTDRYDTAAKVADYGVAHGMHWDGVGVATGLEFPDALSGGAMLGRMDSVLLLTKQAALVSAARQRLSANKADIDTVYFIGGTAAVSQSVRDDVAGVLE